MYAIYATRIDYCDMCDGMRNEDGESVVATFNFYQCAKNYIEKSRLKKRVRMREFRDRSLLAGYVSARIDKYVPKMPPHLPKVTWE